MKKKIYVGLRAVIVLIVIYAIEMAMLGGIYRFLSKVPYRFVAPPIVITAMAAAWLAIYSDMKKRGGR
jgi:hypothetical protein